MLVSQRISKRKMLMTVANVHIFDFGDRDKDTIESAYFCLSMLVKILWRKLAKNIKKSFGHFMPLFGNFKEYVRRFAAEAVAFLLRKVDDLRGIVTYLVTQSGESRLIDGMGSLLFNVYNGIGGGYHSSASSLLTDIVNGVLAIDDLSIREYGSNILERMLHCNVAYIQRSKVSTASLSIPETVLTGSLKESGTMCFATHLARLIPILFLERRQHFIFTKEKELLQAIQTVLKCSWFSLKENFLSFISLCVHRLFADSTWNIAVRDLFKILLSPDVSSEATIDLKLDALNSLVDHGSFDLYIVPLVGSLSTSLLQNNGGLDDKVRPYKLDILLNSPPPDKETQELHAWNPYDRSVNIFLKEDDVFMFHRHPVAQSTDCIRGKMTWPQRQRGTHAVVGVSNKIANLHAQGYTSLIGTTTESYGWGLTRGECYHDSRNCNTYPYETASGESGLQYPLIK